MIRLLFVAVLCLHFGQAFGQLTIGKTAVVKGVVVSEGVGVPYAHVYFAGTEIGTVTNSFGEFEIRVPDGSETSNLVLTVSGIGFRTYNAPAASLSIHGTVIELVPDVIQLAELIVTAKNDSAVEILERAVGAVRKNFPRKRHQLEAFYRELSVRDTIYTRLIEAAVLIDEPSYKPGSVDSENLSVAGNRIQIMEMRKSDDNRTYDRIAWLYNKIFGEKNDIYAVLDDNLVRYIGRKGSHYLSKDFLSQYDIQMVDVTKNDGDLIYVIRLE
jgi:hypothetical protein